MFTTVDAVRRAAYVNITGVLEGASAATEVAVPVSSSSAASLAIGEACERYALIAMDKPGRYRLEVWVRSGSYLSECRLSVANP